MKILDLINEIDEIIETSSSVPLTGKIMVDAEELAEIAKDIKDSLPDEIHQAQWIQSEKDRILDEAKKEYDVIVTEAKRHAEGLVEKDEILIRARRRAEELMQVTEANVKQLKMSTYDYVDGILFSFQQRIEQLNNVYFSELFNNIDSTFAQVNNIIGANRDEIKDMAYKTSIGTDMKIVDNELEDEE